MREYNGISGNRSEIVHSIYKILSSKEYSNISKIVLFGSVSRGDYSEESDYDFAVFSDSLTESKLMRNNEYTDILDILCNCIGLNSKNTIDILTFGTNSKKSMSIFESIEKDGVLLYDKT